MSPYNITIKKGETFGLSLALFDSGNVPVNLSGCLISGFIKTKYGDSSNLTNLNVVITNSGSGIVSLNIPSSGTVNLPVNISFYDIKILNTGTSQVTRLLDGKVFVYPTLSF